MELQNAITCLWQKDFWQTCILDSEPSFIVETFNSTLFSFYEWYLTLLRECVCTFTCFSADSKKCDTRAKKQCWHYPICSFIHSLPTLWYRLNWLIKLQPGAGISSSCSTCAVCWPPSLTLASNFLDVRLSSPWSAAAMDPLSRWTIGDHCPHQTNGQLRPRRPPLSGKLDGRQVAVFGRIPMDPGA